MGLLQRFADPAIGKHLLRDEGEVIVDEVGHHWIVYTLPVIEVVGAVALLCATPFVALGMAWVPMLLALAVALHALWQALSEHMDRFVVTNMRVFRVQGVLGQQVATMPLSRILDITVTKPLQGRLLGYGHFVFESAAQEQGLRDIRYVARPDQRDLAIQRVVARAGLRPSVN
ncbi:PH domain-containing protein [Nocardioides sp.]|uniref:PH domain-containing protein n=1 Tax=Nocardioides sp. TaxID=35761 RepID=UPI002B9DF9FE|nr:PH domain-containing protein [Nocardioides sp.]HSX66620.1 PH domain-containing protein [Nocardioides sp.]